MNTWCDPGDIETLAGEAFDLDPNGVEIGGDVGDAPARLQQLALHVGELEVGIAAALIRVFRPAQRLFELRDDFPAQRAGLASHHQSL